VFPECSRGLPAKSTGRSRHTQCGDMEDLWKRAVGVDAASRRISSFSWIRLGRQNATCWAGLNLSTIQSCWEMTGARSYAERRSRGTECDRPAIATFASPENSSSRKFAQGSRAYRALSRRVRDKASPARPTADRQAVALVCAQCTNRANYRCQTKPVSES